MGDAVVSDYLLNIIRCPDTRRVMREALNHGWEWVGYTKSGHVEIRWPETGAVLHCATTPSDPNSWKTFAKNIKQLSGVEAYRKGNRRRSRKNPLAPDPQVLAAQRKHREQYAARLAREEAEARAAESARRRQAIAAATAAAEERHRREIEALMRPGWGR